MSAIAGASWWAHARGPAPPDVGTLGKVAPEVELLLREKAAAIAGARTDSAAWGEFGMACEANGLVLPARDAYRRAASLDAGNPRWPYRLASVDTRAGDSAAALADLARAASLAPGYAPIHWRTGLLLIDANDLAGAEREFAKATELDARDPAGLTGVARVYLLRGDNQAAATALERLLARDPGDRYAMQLLGTALERLGRHDEAAAMLTTGASGQPSWSDPWTDEMLDWRRGFAVRLKDATAYFESGQHEQAIRLLEQLSSEKPEDTALLAHLGEAYVAAGRAADGARVLERVVAREPKRFDAWVRLSSAYLNQERFEPARAAVERALAENPDYAPAHETSGLILWRDGADGRALDEMNKAIALDPRDTRAMVWAGMIETNAGRFDRALAIFTQATKVDPTLVPAWLGVANARMSQNALPEAAAAVARATMLAGEAPAVIETAERLKQLESARR